MNSRSTKITTTLAVGITTSVLIIIGALLLLKPFGDVSKPAGSAVIYDQTIGAYQVRVDRSPNPPIPSAPMHLTFTVSKAATAEAVSDAIVTLEPDMPGMPMPGMVSASVIHAAANTYTTQLPVDMEGLWLLHVKIQSPNTPQAEFTLQDTVEKPQTSPLQFWIIGILVGLPLVAGLAWYILGRKNSDDDDDDNADNDKLQTGVTSPQAVGTKSGR